MARPIALGQSIPPDLLLRAYSTGVSPMADNADDPEVFWVQPDLRGIIPLDGFHVPKAWPNWFGGAFSTSALTMISRL